MSDEENCDVIGSVIDQLQQKQQKDKDIALLALEKHFNEFEDKNDGQFADIVQSNSKKGNKALYNQFLSRAIIIGSEFIINNLIRCFDEIYIVQQLTKSPQQVGLLPAVYEIFISQGNTMSSQICQMLLNIEINEGNYEIIQILLQNLLYLSTINKDQIYEVLYDDIEKIQQLIELNDNFEIKCLIYQLIISLDNNYFQEMQYVIKDQYFLEKGTKQEKDEFNQLYKQLDGEFQQNSFKQTKKQFGKDYYEIYSREQYNCYQLIVNVFQDYDLNNIVRQSPLVQDYIGFNPGNTNSYQQSKQLKKHMKIGKLIKEHQH